jgi:transposase
MRKQYDYEFKVEAVKASEEIGTSRAAREMNVPITTLELWKKKSREGTLGIRENKRKMKELALEKENRILKQKLRETEETLEILKEATAFFARSQKK